jgi:two-component system response regulator NreC
MATLLKKRRGARSKEIGATILTGQPRTLTQREREVVSLIAQGYKNREAAEQLGISVKTVETHRANIMNKLALPNLAQLIHYAIKTGLISIETD